MHDAVHLFARAMRRLDSPAVKTLDCEEQENWGHGASLINFMKDASINLHLIKVQAESFSFLYFYTHFQISFLYISSHNPRN